MLSTSFECFDPVIPQGLKVRRRFASYKRWERVQRTVLPLFTHKAPLIRGPGTAVGGMREISAASLVFAQAPALGVLALAALNFAR